MSISTSVVFSPFHCGSLCVPTALPGTLSLLLWWCTCRASWIFTKARERTAFMISYTLRGASERKQRSFHAIFIVSPLCLLYIMSSFLPMLI
ncbi:hypothetical protein EDC04DRAFT_1053872 [Pisolithus marmoratus]|nr:hypothetical protein EDC04DRAFT_1053872 [Pisolithus marmoratus]